MAADVWRAEAEAQFERLQGYVPALARASGVDEQFFNTVLNLKREAFIGLFHKKLLGGWKPKKGYATDIGVPSLEEGRKLLAQAVAKWRASRVQGGGSVEGLTAYLF